MTHDDYRSAENEIRRSAERKRRAEKKRKTRTARTIAAVAAFAAAFGAVGGGAATGIRALQNSGSLVLTSELSGESAVPTASDESGDPAPTLTSAETTSGSSSGAAASSDTTALTAEDVAEQGLSSVVAITSVSVQEVQNRFGAFGVPGGGRAQTYESTSMGTGVLIDRNEDLLYIATNAHVIEGADTLTAAFADGSAAEAEIIGEDAENDLAVIAVRIADLADDTLSAISVVPIGSSSRLKLGESVMAIGNALGYGQSVSMGIVSALDRTMDGGEGIYAEGLIQTDAAINPGNSGGALLNMQGELVGINSAKYASTEVEGMGYAIPISAAWPILTAMISGSGAA